MNKYVKELIFISSIVGIFFILLTYTFTNVFEDIYADTDTTIVVSVLGALFLPMLYYVFYDMTRSISRFYGNCKNGFVMWFSIIVTILEIAVMCIAVFVTMYGITVKIRNMKSFDEIMRTLYEYRYVWTGLSALMILSRMSFAFTIKLDYRDKA